MTSTTSANLFTCTFCFRLSSGPPQILGRSARLACKTCCTILLDLSIYWVCGELIFRGEDCVSFGWCFWHKACYGCLLCGNRLVHRGVKIPALFAGEPKQKNGRGKELTEAPICAPCMVDSEVDGVTEEVLVKRGLRRVERYDAGVTRKRWEEREGEAGRDGGKGKARATNLETGKLSRGFGIDGAGEGASQDSTIWVNLSDPINGPSFKPSPLKPIPWLQPRALPTTKLEALYTLIALDLALPRYGSNVHLVWMAEMQFYQRRGKSHPQQQQRRAAPTPIITTETTDTRVRDALFCVFDAAGIPRLPKHIGAHGRGGVIVALDRPSHS
ncbi:unnamed protein product [Clonostachys rhizophaga]|uniref:LIM zinc-binding domain-containing protein n=1 Tax=Clonostachys rhizophaga TaxID=160324 RepID=A0A9N9YRX4_9HYPO|nr:unnamed protein product [Clonostachys rhizophaga]